tara:strand:+ start:211 stop:1092 length:882 start_codon:yes stop_codon:yes gene_type:complete
MSIIHPKNLSNESKDLNSSSKLFEIYKNLNLTSLKCDTYFQTYEELFNEYVGKEITFVEVGVLHGGSLLMWREYFGPKARIIGIDLDPRAKELEQKGFEIFIGSQSDKNFWKKFYSTIGKIDVLLDDGGHVNDQQIITLSESIDNTNNNGTIVIEDVHTSYLKKFGNPSRVSFVNYSKYLIDVINSRFDGVESKNEFKKKIYSIQFFNSLVAFKINTKKSINSTIIKNSDIQRSNVADHRTNDYFPTISSFIDLKLPILKKLPVIKKIIRYFFYTHNIFVKLRYYLKLRKYFK